MGTLSLAHRLSLLFTSLVLVATLLPSLASAQKHAKGDEKRARVHFEEGRLAFTEGRYDDALLHFQESYTLSHRPALLFNIANVLDRLRRDDEAIDQYQQYLREVPDASNRDQVEERLAVLQRSAEERRAAQAAPPVVVPTAQEVAAAQQPAPQTFPSAPAEPPSETRPLYKKWWVWTAVGSAVVAAVVIGVVASSGSTEKQQSALVVDGMTRQVEL